MKREDFPPPYHLSDDEIVDEIMTFAFIEENPNKWLGRVWKYFQEKVGDISANIEVEVTEEMLKDAPLPIRAWGYGGELTEEEIKARAKQGMEQSIRQKIIGRISAINSRTRDEGKNRIGLALDELISQEREQILEISRKLAKDASLNDKKSITQTEVKKHIKSHLGFMATPDAKSIVWARSNLVLRGLMD